LAGGRPSSDRRFATHGGRSPFLKAVIRADYSITLSGPRKRLTGRETPSSPTYHAVPDIAQRSARGKCG